jgi:hypothetical protein
MIRRTLVIVLLLALLAPAAAVAQGGGPFSPLPPAQPTPAPTPEPSNDSLTSDLGGRNTLYLIGGALLVAFVGIGMFISRDARRSLPAGHRPGSGLREQGPHQHKRQAKAKARQRTRAQRAARRKNR